MEKYKNTRCYNHKSFIEFQTNMEIIQKNIQMKEHMKERTHKGANTYNKAQRNKRRPHDER